ncbi:MAG: M20/M25/M40 family metallo-hydrolase [Acidobacteria bacterium]|nr:M20/M25/M40 family metallo-hydrolase [Acidobacteriota bacterium]MBV9478326.1 M20/M25/M40 family metallo-hydrolase [Acidobacteriota bacterium]
MNAHESPDAARKRRRHRNERIAATALVLILGAGVVAFLRWNRAEEERIAHEQVYVPKKQTITREVLQLRDYVRIDTSTPRGEAAGARWLVAQFAARGVAAELIESAPGRFNVYARLRGRKPGGGLLLFNHIDVVPPGDGWTHAPFAGVIELNQLYGRGVIDMKALALCQLWAFAELAHSGEPPEHDLVFLATADEETGSEFGMQWLLAHRPDVFANIAYGVTEGGITEMLSERMTYFGIEVGGKQYEAFTVTADSREQLERARIALEPWVVQRDAYRVLPAVRKMFRGLAPTRTQYRSILTDIDGAIAKGTFWKLPISYRDLTQNTLWVEAPRQENGRWIMELRLVNLPDEHPDARIAWALSVVQPFGARLDRVLRKEGMVPLSDDGTPFFALLASEGRRRYRTEAGVEVLYKSATDARFLRPRGILCYGIAPYPIDYFQSIAIHHADERIRLDFFMQGVDYLREVVRAWARQP